MNLRTGLLRILKRAGVQPWPKLWQNLQATRQTELADQFPSHVVCQWVGNSPDVAREHCLRVTDAHIDAATQCSALQDPVHQVATTSTNEESGEGKKHKNPREIEGFVSCCNSLPDSGSGPYWTRTSDLLHVKQAL